ncbi:MAG: hypothetical protein AAGG44_01650 [Planctomycetota bacterium]
MKTSQPMLAFPVVFSVTSVFISMLMPGCVQAQSKGTRLEQPDKEFSLQVFDNTDTLGQIIDVDRNGNVIGSREEPDEQGFVFSTVYFYDDGKKVVELGVLDEYTSSEVEALSDAGIAVGYATRRMGHPKGSLTAFLWDIKANKLVKLNAAEGDFSCHAQGVSADGSTIVGYTTGSNPPKLRPCVWSKEGEDWQCTPLPTLELHNPFVMSSSVVISPDGTKIAACPTESFLAGRVDSSLFMWKKNDDGIWERKLLSAEQAHLHAINNDGLIVGSVTAPRGKKSPVLFDAEGKMTSIDLLDGTVSGIAFDVSSTGVVVGTCDDPPGPDGGPHAFVWKQGKTIPLMMPKETVYSYANAINDAGQIAGFADITFPERKDEESGEPLVKTLGFLWKLTATTSE